MASSPLTFLDKSGTVRCPEQTILVPEVLANYCSGRLDQGPRHDLENLGTPEAGQVLQLTIKAVTPRSLTLRLTPEQ
jgi:hypothetical protein